MILVVGLGNPGRRYADSRHNAGFRVVDRLARRFAPAAWRANCGGQLARVTVARSPVLLLKPQTYMNQAGRSVRPVAAHFGVAPADVLVIHDEIDLPFGALRLKKGGGDAGHNGVRSVRCHLGTDGFRRLRVGVGRPPADFGGDVADYVLQAFPLAEAAALPDVVDRAAEAVSLVIERGLSEAMNVVNQRAPR